MESQDFLVYLQQVLKQHNLESSLEELAAICSKYEIEKIEHLEPDTIAGIHDAVIGNRQQKASQNNSVGNNSLATIMRQKFQKKVETEAKQIVEDYKNVPIKVQETVVKAMLQQYVQKNPKIEDFLHEADYAKIAEENIQQSQKMLKTLLLGILVIIGLLFASSLMESVAKIATKPQVEPATYRLQGLEPVKGEKINDQY